MKARRRDDMAPQTGDRTYSFHAQHSADLLFFWYCRFSCHCHNLACDLARLCGERNGEEQEIKQNPLDNKS